MKNDVQYLKIAQIWAESSYATKRKVGAVIVKDLTIISDGYNGTASGFPNVCEDDKGATFDHVLHAETNAIMKLAKSTQSALGATMYITIPPCLNCAKIIYQAGIKRVVWGNETNKTEGIDFLTKAGVQCEYININGREVNWGENNKCIPPVKNINWVAKDPLPVEINKCCGRCIDGQDICINESENDLKNYNNEMSAAFPKSNFRI